MVEQAVLALEPGIEPFMASSRFWNQELNQFSLEPSLNRLIQAGSVWFGIEPGPVLNPT